MARCRTLLKENEELGKQISQGRIAKLEGEIALEKKLVEEMRVAQNGKGLPMHSSKLSLWLRCCVFLYYWKRLLNMFSFHSVLQLCWWDVSMP